MNQVCADKGGLMTLDYSRKYFSKLFL